MWVDSGKISDQPVLTGYQLYFQEKEYFLGLSYAMAIAFTVFTISRLKTNRSRGTLGIFSGIPLSAALYAFVVF